MTHDDRYIREIWLEEGTKPGGYLSRLPVVKSLRQNGGLKLNSPVTFLVGENGSGKSTLLEAVAVAFGFNAEGGSRNFNFTTEPSHSELWQHLTLSKGRHAADGYFLRAESFYNVASEIDQLDRIPCAGPPIIDGYGGVSLHKQSHGESFLALVQKRFRGKGLYLLDEPEAALSPFKQMTLLVEIDRLVKRGSQFIIATHSPILLTFPRARVYQFSADGIEAVDYRETEHFQLSKRFLNDPDRMLKWLLEEAKWLR